MAAILVTSDMRPIPHWDDDGQAGWHWPMGEARALADARAGLPSGDTAHAALPAEHYAIVWASRFGADPAWHVFPRLKGE